MDSGVSLEPVSEHTEEAPSGELFSADQMGGVVVNDPKPAAAATTPSKPKTQKTRGVWKDKIGSFMGNIFDSVMNEVDSDR